MQFFIIYLFMCVNHVMHVVFAVTVEYNFLIS